MNNFNRNPSNISQLTKALYNINVKYNKLQWKHSVCNNIYYNDKNIRPVEHCHVWEQNPQEAYCFWTRTSCTDLIQMVRFRFLNNDLNIDDRSIYLDLSPFLFGNFYEILKNLLLSFSIASTKIIFVMNIALYFI